MTGGPEVLPLDPDGLPSLRFWRSANGPTFTPWDFLQATATLEQAAAFATLFWPDLVEHEGAVYLAEHFDAANVARWRREAPAIDGPGLERVLNHCHLSDRLATVDGLAQGALRHLAGVLAATWSCRLAHRFPSRVFEVSWHEDADGDITITFWQSPPHAEQAG